MHINRAGVVHVILLKELLGNARVLGGQLAYSLFGIPAFNVL